MDIQNLEITFSSDVVKRIESLGLKKIDIEARIRLEYKDLPVFPPKKTDIVVDFNSFETWQQYLILGNVRQKGAIGYIEINGLGEKIGATESGEAKVYKLSNVEGGITLREHIQNLKRRKLEEENNNKSN